MNLEMGCGKRFFRKVVPVLMRRHGNGYNRLIRGRRVSHIRRASSVFHARERLKIEDHILQTHLPIAVRISGHTGIQPENHINIMVFAD